MCRHRFCSIEHRSNGYADSVEQSRMGFGRMVVQDMQRPVQRLVWLRRVTKFLTPETEWGKFALEFKVAMIVAITIGAFLAPSTLHLEPSPWPPDSGQTSSAP